MMYAQPVTVYRGPAVVRQANLPTYLTAPEKPMPAMWHNLAFSKIHTLESGGAVFEGVGSLKIDPTTAAYARRVLDLLHEKLTNEILPAPTVSAISGGGIGIFWRAGAKEVEAVIYPDSTTSFLATKGDEIQSEDEFAGDKVNSLSDALRLMLQG
jgi:hypothetical protein